MCAKRSRCARRIISSIHAGRVREPGDIARMCLFLCDEANDFLNGQTLTVDGGATIRMIYPE